VAHEAQTYSRGITSTSASIVIKASAQRPFVPARATAQRQPARNPQAENPNDWLLGEFGSDTFVFNL
jgi:hypothetical protein